MQSKDTAVLVIGIFLGLIILFNFAAVFMARKNQEKTTKKYKNYSNMLSNISNPFQKEEKELEKLSGLVNKLRTDNKKEE